MPVAPCGIIPALAGNTAPRARPPRSARDHPRACGEHSASNTTACVIRGSSPRLRGTHRGRYTGRKRQGIIPALAGNTRRGTGTSPCSRDHPRACGEHLPLRRYALTSWGSSPRLRGTHDSPGVDGRTGGIIPALAGNTSRVHSVPSGVRDHPRACGEH